MENISLASALLIIDVQQGLFHKSTPIYNADQLLQNVRLLVDRAHHAGIPVIYVQHANKNILMRDTPNWQLHPSLQPLEDELVIHKQHGSAFEGTNLSEELQKLGVNHLVICGLVTHGCVKAACQEALKKGYQVTLASDTHSNYSKDAAKLIETWNMKLAQEGADVIKTEVISF